MNLEQYKMLKQAIEEHGVNAVLSDLCQLISDHGEFKHAHAVLEHALDLIETLDNMEAR